MRTGCRVARSANATAGDELHQGSRAGLAYCRGDAAGAFELTDRRWRSCASWRSSASQAINREVFATPAGLSPVALPAQGSWISMARCVLGLNIFQRTQLGSGSASALPRTPR